MEPSTYLGSAGKAFWNEDFWLPPNVTWSMLNPETTPTPSVHFCNFRDLGFPLVACWVMLAIKFVFENIVFRAVGKLAGLPERNKRTMPPTNDVLEAEFQSGRRLDHTNIARYERQAISSFCVPKKIP